MDSRDRAHGRDKYGPGGGNGGRRDRDRGHEGSGNGDRHRSSYESREGSSRDSSNQERKRSRESSVGSSKSFEAPPKRRDPPAAGKKGRTLKLDLVHTRPANRENKSGKTDDKTREMSLKANYFRVPHKRDWQLYQFHVTFDPEIETTAMKRRLFGENVKNINVGSFDGTTLITNHRFDDLQIIEGINKIDSSPIKIEIKYIKDVSYLTESFIQTLNKIIRLSMEGLRLQLVGRNFFDAVAKTDIPQYRFQLWPGYKTSIRQHESEILMCAEIITKVMRGDTLYDILRDCMYNNRDGREAFARTVIGCTVLTDYNNKTYKITDVDNNQSPSSTFDTKNGPISYVDYYKNRYRIRIKDPNQPLLISRSNDKQRRGGQTEYIALIPELCRATGLTEDMRKNWQLMRSVADVTRLNAAQRVERLERFSERLRHTSDSMDVLQKWGMNLDSRLIEFTGRKLSPPRLVFSDKSEEVEKDWAQKLRSARMETVMENWFIICTEQDYRYARGFENCLYTCTRGMNMHISQAKIITLRSGQVYEYANMLEQVAREDPKMVLVLVPNDKSDRYAAIKKKTILDRAILTQVVQFKTLSGRGQNARGLNMSVVTKVAIQMACKMGSAPWKVVIPLTKLCVIGFDVSRDKNDKRKTFGSLVASMDCFQTKYFSAVSQQVSGDDLSHQFTLNVIKAIREFKEQNENELPNKILIYRDGVGDGQLQHVINEELEPLKKQLEQMYQQAPRLTFVVVTKRNNTRLFTGNNRNPPAGTVVDDTITLPERYDFYLVPVETNQGTVSPTYYNVIYDKIELPPEKMQALTYMLCHGYFNWTGPIKVPAVCQYASKLAALCSQHLHDVPPTTNNELHKKLYFL